MNAVRGEELCRAAKELGADIALFPEMWSLGYHSSLTDLPDWGRLAEPSDGPFVGHFSALARELEMAIAITYLEAGTPTPRNSMTLLDRWGRALFTYAKVHLCRWEEPEQSLLAGEDFPVAELETAKGPVQVGAMICFDREFPESARILMLKGAEIILTPNACRLDTHRLGQFQSRAFENMVAVTMANYAASPAREENGHSVAYSPVCYDEAGRTLDNLIVMGGEDEQILIADIDLQRLREYRSREMMGNAMRRPSTYGELMLPQVNSPFRR